ncbi:hypothetical protein GKJPGBOP_05513 [Streptomyces paromomycinus]|uniref:Uncharacterized protein n=1 Tax=Streptomyces paromomycinus TaxID=92743 RepID=A0A401W8Z0_STREY|nr:hypothetical protein GKJPGBOP_05513 [Streptomyces paromomycinus]
METSWLFEQLLAQRRASGGPPTEEIALANDIPVTEARTTPDRPAIAASETAAPSLTWPLEQGRRLSPDAETTS